MATGPTETEWANFYVGGPRQESHKRGERDKQQGDKSKKIGVKEERKKRGLNASRKLPQR